MKYLHKTCIWLVSTALSGCAGLFNPGLEQARKAQRSIFVSAVKASQLSKNGFMSAHIEFYNTSGNIYKYVDFDVTAYNRVGDPVTNPGDQGPYVRLRFTGPLSPRRTPGPMIWPRTWQTVAISCVHINRIEISHMNGTHQTLEGSELAAHLSEHLHSGCMSTISPPQENARPDRPPKTY